MGLLRKVNRKEIEVDDIFEVVIEDCNNCKKSHIKKYWVLNRTKDYIIYSEEDPNREVLKGYRAFLQADYTDRFLEKIGHNDEE